MSIHRKQYSQEFKMEMVEASLSGKSPLIIGKENNLNPNLISRWKRQYLNGRFHRGSENDTEIRKLKIKVCELEQMVGKLTMENYILKKEKEFIAQAALESKDLEHFIYLVKMLILVNPEYLGSKLWNFYNHKVWNLFYL